MVEELDLRLSAGPLRAQRLGPADAPLTLLVHGLSANMHAFDNLMPALAAPDRQLIAVDLRGRGRSPASGPFGLDAHARDLLDVADLVGARRFDCIGWSMGGAIGIVMAGLAPQRLRSLTLIDFAGAADKEAKAKVIRGLGRLDIVSPDKSAYLDAVRAAIGIKPWTAFWDRYFDYELQPCEQGWRPITSRAACLADLEDISARDWPALWRALDMPVLLVRCNGLFGGGFVVPCDVRDALLAAAPSARVFEDASDHFTVMNSAAAFAAIREFVAMQQDRERSGSQCS